MSDSYRAAPIVLAHGLLGFERIGLRSWTLAHYFRGIPEYLTRRGYRVFVPRVHPTAGIERRARKLAERIETAFPGESVHLVGHSMGGLDARALVELPGWSDRVLSLTTVGTPHLGSRLAEYTYPRVGLIYATLRAVGWDHQGFYDILPDRALRFHESHALPDWIPAYSHAGVTSPAGVSWPLRALFGVHERLDGPNDGLVSQRSALAFGAPARAVELDHFHQMNWCTGTRGLHVWSPVRKLYQTIAATIRTHDPVLAEIGDRAVEPDYAPHHVHEVSVPWNEGASVETGRRRGSM